MIVFMFVVSFLGLFSLIALCKVMIIDYKLTYPSGTVLAMLINNFQYGTMDQTTPSVHKSWSEAGTSSTSSASAATYVFPASPASPSSMAPSSLASTPGPLPATSTTKVTSQPSPLSSSTNKWCRDRGWAW